MAVVAGLLWLACAAAAAAFCLFVRKTDRIIIRLYEHDEDWHVE